MNSKAPCLLARAHTQTQTEANREPRAHPHAGRLSLSLFVLFACARVTCADCVCTSFGSSCVCLSCSHAFMLAAAASPPRVLFLTDNVSSESPLNPRRVWLPLRSSPYVQTWEECEGVSLRSAATLPLGAVCGSNTLEADRFARGLHTAASRTIRQAPARELQAKAAAGAGVQLLREAIRAAAVSHFVACPEETLRAAWATLATLGEEICSLPRLAFLNLLKHRLCTSGEVRRRLRGRRGLAHLAPEEAQRVARQSAQTSVPALLEDAGWSRRQMLLLATELGVRGLRLSEELEQQAYASLSNAHLGSSLQVCENCRGHGALQVVLVRGRGQKRLLLRQGKEARFHRKVDSHRRKYPRNRWRLRRVCSLCSVIS